MAGDMAFSQGALPGALTSRGSAPRPAGGDYLPRPPICDGQARKPSKEFSAACNQRARAAERFLYTVLIQYTTAMPNRAKPMAQKYANVYVPVVSTATAAILGYT